MFGFNFRMGLALNDRSSFSVGYDHASVGRTRINGQDPLGVRVQPRHADVLATPIACRQTARFNVCSGSASRAITPDLTLTHRMPITLVATKESPAKQSLAAFRHCDTARAPGRQ